MDDPEQLATRVETAAWNGQETAQAKIEDTADAVKSKTEIAKVKAAHATEKLAAGVSAAADKVAQAAADPEKRQAAQEAVKAGIRRNPWMAAVGAFLAGLRLGRKLPRR